MKPRSALPALAALATASLATAAWGHPGHGAVGDAHHFIDFVALGGICLVIGVAWVAGLFGGNDHD